MKILVINPNTTATMTEADAAAARSVAREDTQIVAVTSTFGPSSIESYYDATLCAPAVVDEVLKGEEQGFDAYIIAGYADPALHACREITRKPVVGIAEASLYMASMLAARFSIITVIPHIKTMLEDLVAAAGFSRKLVSIRATSLRVLDIQKDLERSFEVLGAACREAKEQDDAEAILLGCAGFAPLAKRLEEELQIPVLDGVICATKLAEALVDLGKATSKHGTYRFPERKGFDGIFERFGRHWEYRPVKVPSRGGR